MITPRKYGWVALTAARSSVAYLGEVATRTIFLGVILFIFLQLWRVTYSEMEAERLGGLTLAQMLWYLAMTEAITISGTRVTEEVDRDVRTGALAVQLMRPIYYPLYRLGNYLGERAIRFALNIVVSVTLVLIFVGTIPLTLSGLLMVALVLPIAFTLDFTAQMLIGLAAFWIEDTSGLLIIYQRLVMILGGMLIPLELFPESMQRALDWLPFATIVYGPARLFVRPDGDFLMALLLRQGLFLTLFAVAVAALYRVAVARINANGG